MHSVTEKVLRATPRLAVPPEGRIARRVVAFVGERKKCNAFHRMTRCVTSSTESATAQKVRGQFANLAQARQE